MCKNFFEKGIYWILSEDTVDVRTARWTENVMQSNVICSLGALQYLNA